MWSNTSNVFYKTRAVCNTCSKGRNLDRSKCALGATHKIYVYILRSKCGKTPEMFSIKRVPLVILSRKETSIVAIVRSDKIYVYILRSKCGKTPEMFSIKRVRFVILARKGGISIAASVLWEQHTRYMCIFFVLNVEKHQKCFL